MPAIVLTRGVAVSLVALSLGQVSLFAMPAGMPFRQRPCGRSFPRGIFRG